MKNYYIENIGEIAKIAYEQKVDWSVALAQWNYRRSDMLTDEAGELMREFLAYVAGKVFGPDGAFVGYVWQDGSVHVKPEETGK